MVLFVFLDATVKYSEQILNFTDLYLHIFQHYTEEKAFTAAACDA